MTKIVRVLSDMLGLGYCCFTLLLSEFRQSTEKHAQFHPKRKATHGLQTTDSSTATRNLVAPIVHFLIVVLFSHIVPTHCLRTVNNIACMSTIP